MSFRSIQAEHPAQGFGPSDQALFAMAVHVLKEHHDLGRMWPLSYTLPNGRSIEAVCDRAAHLTDMILGALAGFCACCRVSQWRSPLPSLPQPAMATTRRSCGRSPCCWRYLLTKGHPAGNGHVDSAAAISPV